MITVEVAVAHTQCRLKAYHLLFSDKKSTFHEYVFILKEKSKRNREKYLSGIKKKIPEAITYSPEKMKKGIPILLEANLVFGDLEVYADVLTKTEGLPYRKKYNYIPTLVVGTHKINKEQKLQLAFIGHVLSQFQKVKPTIGIIIGSGDKKHKIRLEPLYKEVERTLRKLRNWISSPAQEAPPIILNKHCPYCQFQRECEAKAKEQDYLSLLKGMSEKEILDQNKKGIFTVTQLSYTYRPRKRRNRKKVQPSKYYPSLRALAIRDEKIYVVEKPEIPQSYTQIYLDVEGIPDQNYYYLIGLVVTDEISTKNFSFWADNRDEEEKIWNKFVCLIKSYRDFTIFHYGSYETKFIEKMSKKYGRKEDEEIINNIGSNLVNALSLIYANIYFPTYSNSLKDIGVYLGKKWSEENATGLQSLVWWYNWSETSDGIIKEKLITYNMEDCFALKKVIEVIGNISVQPEGSISNVTSTNDLKQRSLYNFGSNHFLFDDLDFVNKSAYFDYQREKVFFREKRKVVKQKAIGTITGNTKYRINKHIEIALPRKCYKCGSVKIIKHQKCSKIVLDLKYFKYGVKRWIVKYSTSRVLCKNCEATLMPEKYKKIRSKHGYQLHVWTIYQLVTLRQSYTRIQENLRGVFGLYFYNELFTRFKTRIAERYNPAYNKILKKLKNGNLIHADETSVSIKGVIAYVWVFTSLEEVYYVYNPTREGKLLKEILKEFNGVLVSDFYDAYDSANCLQQKCIIHLIRDMNDDLLKNPFNAEYKALLKDFSSLLRSIVATIDKYGLKARFLKKHKRAVNIFYKKIMHESGSELVIKYQKRFKKYWCKLFTFLDYDGVPWNNNNAEHAIKAFAAYRKLNNGSHTENGIKTYLLLLSVYKTCEYRGIDFLQFMLSGETDIDQFCNG